ncbi:MAG: TolC family protein, partial [Fimbriimonadaceae bacterium]
MLAPAASPQPEPTLAQLVAQAVSASPTVAARQLQINEADAMAKSMGSPKNPELEIAPGVGFTNSNFVVGQSFDLSGTRAARAQKARAETNVARANLRRAQLSVAAEFLTAFSAFLASRRNTENAKAGLLDARATVDAIRKRIEIGEAPAVQLTRAEIELSRAEQTFLLAKNDLLTSTATLNSLLAQPTLTVVSMAAWISVG